MKHSIKRVQSQAGLSFAEREDVRPKVKQKLLFLLVLLLTATTGAWAQDQSWDSGDCTVTLSDGVLTVSGTGDMEDYEDYNQLPWNVYEIKTIVIESGVTSIGTYAFSYCSNLESVSIPASVTSIDELAFQGCGSDAAALTVSFAEGSTPLTIGESAFVNANLKSIDIPNRVTSIGRGAFSYCGNLESVSIPASVTSIGGEAFQKCGSEAAALTVSFAEGLTPLTISGNAFYEANLKSIDIPNRVTSIGDGAFTGCSNLESISIPASVTSIGNYAFTSCSNLESISIPASVTSIGDGAFSYCSKLAKVYIFAPNLTTYGKMAFDGNAAGRKIYVLPKAVDTYKAGWPAYAAYIEAMPTYAITLAEGTEDADKWTVKVGEGKAQKLPLEGLEGGEKITATYSGTRKVKSVKAVKKAAVSFTEVTTFSELQTALSAGKNVKLMNDIECTAGIGITSNGALTIDGNGKKLTLNSGLSLASGATLTIQGNGTMVVNGTNNSTVSTVAGSTGTLILTSGTLTATGGNGLEVDGDEEYTDNREYAGGNAINGNVTVSGGTLTAKGGNGGSVGDYSRGSYGADGGVAISGSVTVTDGTVTATGGNGGSIGDDAPDAKGGSGGAAIGGDATVNGGTWTASNGTNGGGGDGGKAVAGTVTDNR